jgi:hypothetical protein
MGSSKAVRIRALTRLLAAVGVFAMVGGGVLVAINIRSAYATTTLSLTTSAPGASCNNSNPSQPVCFGLANGDVVNVAGTGFTPGSLASIEQCNSDPAQPVLLYLGTDIPVSCSPLALTSIGNTRTTKGKLSGAHTMIGGMNPPGPPPDGEVGPPVQGVTPTCDQTVPTASTIANCTTSGNAVLDAQQFPCPPTAAEQAAGDTCVLAIGDQAGDRAVGIALFGNESLPTPTTTAPTTTQPGATTTLAPNATLTSTTVSSTSINLGPSNSISDNVSVQGSSTFGSPTGNVTVYVCQTGTTGLLTDGACAATAGNELSINHLTAGMTDTSGATSSALFPTSIGTYCFSVVYPGDANYLGSQDNTTTANLDPNECALVYPGATTTASFISTVHITIGPTGAATDAVTVMGGLPGQQPQGTVNFYACHTGVTQTLTPGPCAPTGIPEDANVPLISGAGSTSSATSTNFAPTTIGTWCFSVAYTGSSTYAPSSDNTSPSNKDPNECMTVAPGTADAFTSDNFATAIAGQPFNFEVTTSGTPTPVITKKGHAAPGVHFHKAKPVLGTATMMGTPNKKKSPGTWVFTIKGVWGRGKTKVVLTQTFTLTVLPPGSVLPPA